MSTAVVITLLILGVIFLLIELFLIPGISIAGIAGFISVVAAVIFAYVNLGTTAGHITLIASIIVSALGVWLFIRFRTLDRMALKTDIDGKIEPLKDTDIKVGDLGVTVSRLAPMGTVKINDHIIEAKTNSDFIDQNVEIVVLEVFSTNVLVALPENSK